MKEYEVKLTKQAETQIHEIAWYITVVLKNPDAAENLMDDFDAAMEKLKKHPAAISLTDENHGAVRGFAAWALRIS
ncbi:MAG: type II toxin-antitoxin system RelE/ParE family toxin [Lachnospiraceae bacterium]|nr:type II toxin-antitoxin system RelE/ParE family toxin [Lachnospiraceae bacterium]